LAEWADGQPASGSERRIIGIALSLAGYRGDEPLGELIGGLDATNVTRFLDAVRSAGWHERHWSANIDGLPGG
jgi:hypothetical protein